MKVYEEMKLWKKYVEESIRDVSLMNAGTPINLKDWHLIYQNATLLYIEAKIENET